MKINARINVNRILLFVIGSLLILYSAVLMPAYGYRTAQSLYNQKKYFEAQQIFYELKDYKDSNMMAEQCKKITNKPAF